MTRHLCARSHSICSTRECPCRCPVPSSKETAIPPHCGRSSRSWGGTASVATSAVRTASDFPGSAWLAAGIGGHAAPSLVADTVIVARIAAGGEGVRNRWAQLLTDGTVTAPSRISKRPDHGHLDGITTRASGSGSYVVKGTKVGVHHGLHAGAFAVTVVADGGPALVLVPRDAVGVEVNRRVRFDPSSGSCTVRLSDVHGTVGPSVSLRVRNPGERCSPRSTLEAVVSAAECVGAAEVA